MPQRIKLIVEVDLDPVSGAFHTAAQAHESVGGILSNRIPHYNPEVFFGGYVTVESQYIDTARYVLDTDVTPGGVFFLNDQATIGWWCIRSTDPDKKELFLPDHIFRKCFELGEITHSGWLIAKEKI